MERGCNVIRMEIYGHIIADEIISWEYNHLKQVWIYCRPTVDIAGHGLMWTLDHVCWNFRFSNFNQRTQGSQISSKRTWSDPGLVSKVRLAGWLQKRCNWMFKIYSQTITAYYESISIDIINDIRWKICILWLSIDYPVVYPKFCNCGTLWHLHIHPPWMPMLAMASIQPSLPQARNCRRCCCFFLLWWSPSVRGLVGAINVKKADILDIATLKKIEKTISY